ncbi:peroxiredoxin family protein [Yeosuana sp.]|uniref:peroxiredoxin family protein n=1 Tax=Yeosuana sp. TaxID=2529388 RepID=UPI0040550846
MRKVIISIIFIGLSTILFIVINKAVTTIDIVNEKKTITKSSNNKIPLFEFFTLDSVAYSKYNLKKNKSVIIVYFDPDCSLCQKSGEFFSTFKKFHEDSQILFVSHNTKEKIKAYKNQNNLSNISNIKFLQCNEDNFYNLFKESSTPTYFIYNTKQELIKVINDDVPVKTILRYIKAAQID